MNWSRVWVCLINGCMPNLWQCATLGRKDIAHSLVCTLCIPHTCQHETSFMDQKNSCLILVWSHQCLPASIEPEGWQHSSPHSIPATLVLFIGCACCECTFTRRFSLSPTHPPPPCSRPHVCTRTHTHRHTHTQTHTHKHTFICMCTHAHTHTHVLALTHMQTKR